MNFPLGCGQQVALWGVVGHIKHSALVGDSDKGVYYYPMYSRRSRKRSWW